MYDFRLELFLTYLSKTPTSDTSNTIPEQIAPDTSIEERLPPHDPQA